jgi:hypothetical protein
VAARRPRRIKLSSAIPTTYGVAAAPITRTPTGQSPTTLTPKRPGDARIELGVKAFDARHYDSARWRVPAGCQRPGQPGWRHRQSRTRRRQGHRRRFAQSTCRRLHRRGRTHHRYGGRRAHRRPLARNDEATSCANLDELIHGLGFAPVRVGGLRDGGKLMQLSTCSKRTEN